MYNHINAPWEIKSLFDVPDSDASRHVNDFYSVLMAVCYSPSERKKCLYTLRPRVNEKRSSFSKSRLRVCTYKMNFILVKCFFFIL